MRRNIMIFLLLLFLLFLIACQFNFFTFSGEGDEWSARLEVSQQDEYEEQKLELRYIGNDIDSVGEISYMVETDNGKFGASGGTLPANGVITNSSSRMNSLMKQDSNVEITVNWQDKTEVIILKLGRGF